MVCAFSNTIEAITYSTSHPFYYKLKQKKTRAENIPTHVLKRGRYVKRLWENHANARLHFVEHFLAMITQMLTLFGIPLGGYISTRKWTLAHVGSLTNGHSLAIICSPLGVHGTLLVQSILADYLHDGRK
jgi:hypothetical protein